MEYYFTVKNKEQLKKAFGAGAELGWGSGGPRPIPDFFDFSRYIYTYFY
jgi:hypothetical protein